MALMPADRWQERQSDGGEPLTLGELANPLRLPGRLWSATRATVAAVQLLPRLPAVVLTRLESFDGGVQEIVATLPKLMAEIDRVENTLEPQAERVRRIEEAVYRLEERFEAIQGEVQDATEHLPNHGDGGPIHRMRDALKRPS